MALEPDCIEDCLAVLTRTPMTQNALLRDLPSAWTGATEGPGTWSPYVVVGHSIHAEKADWIPRLTIILEHGTKPPVRALRSRGLLPRESREIALGLAG